LFASAGVAPILNAFSGHSGGSAAASSAASATFAGGGHSVAPVAPLDLPSLCLCPFPAPGGPAALVAVAAASSGMDLSSDADPAVDPQPPSTASPTRTTLSAGAQPHFRVAAQAISPPTGAAPLPTNGLGGPPFARRSRLRRSGRRSAASPTFTAPARTAFGMDVDDAVPAAPLCRSQRLGVYSARGSRCRSPAFPDRVLPGSSRGASCGGGGGGIVGSCDGGSGAVREVFQLRRGLCRRHQHTS